LGTETLALKAANTSSGDVKNSPEGERALGDIVAEDGLQEVILLLLFMLTFPLKWCECRSSEAGKAELDFFFRNLVIT